VEVRTQKHDNCPHHEGFCPRYSPTRKHTLINTTHEARSVTRFEALKAGHLIFPSPSPSTPSISSGIIIFNPTHDLLYLPAESHPLPPTRGPKGTYTQYKKSHSPFPHPGLSWNHNHHISPPSALRSLAIDLERYGSQFNPMRLAIHDFPALEDLCFVAPNWTRANEVRGLQENLKVMQGAWERRQLSAPELEEMEARRREGGQEWALGQRRWPRVRVAVRCEGGRLGVVKGT